MGLPISDEIQTRLGVIRNMLSDDARSDEVTRALLGMIEGLNVAVIKLESQVVMLQEDVDRMRANEEKLVNALEVLMDSAEARRRPLLGRRRLRG